VENPPSLSLIKSIKGHNKISPHTSPRTLAKPINNMASSHSSRSSTPATDAVARSPFPVDADGGAQQKERVELRRGPWTVEEDLALVNYITDHGVGRWNTLAPAAGTLAGRPVTSLNFSMFLLLAQAS
jgi:hypothetical protein